MQTKKLHPVQEKAEFNTYSSSYIFHSYDQDSGREILASSRPSPQQALPKKASERLVISKSKNATGAHILRCHNSCTFTRDMKNQVQSTFKDTCKVCSNAITCKTCLTKWAHLLCSSKLRVHAVSFNKQLDIASIHNTASSTTCKLLPRKWVLRNLTETWLDGEMNQC